MIISGGIESYAAIHIITVTTAACLILGERAMLKILVIDGMIIIAMILLEQYQMIPEKLIFITGFKAIFHLFLGLILTLTTLYFIIKNMKNINEQYREQLQQRKKAETALAKSERFYRTLLEISRDGIMVINPDGKIIYANESMATNLNYYSAEDLIGMDSLNLFDDTEHTRFKDYLRDISLFKNINDKAWKAKKKDGTLIDGELTASLICDESNNPYQIMIITRDISERIRTQAEMQKIAKLESIGNLAGGIAHNFKNVLASMALNIGFIKMKKGDTAKFTERIEKAIGQLSALATRFQTFSTGGAPVVVSSPIIPVIEEAMEIALSGTNVKAQINTTDNIRPVLIDPKQMNEVFINLLINAVHAMPEGGNIYIDVQNCKADEYPGENLAPGEYVEIKVVDEGPGIPKEIAGKIFDPFFTTKTDGNGLGLASAHYILQKHRGSIHIDHDGLDRGACFKINLPVSRDNIQMENKTDDDLKIRNNIKVLFMDDDEDIRENILEFSELMAFEVKTASDGDEAVKLYKEEFQKKSPFDAVVLDLTVQNGKGGEQAIKELIDFDQDVKAIVFSGHSTKPIVANYRDYGFKGRLDKPVSINNLIKVLEDVIGAKK